MFKYRLRIGKTLPIKRTLGWCHSCENFTAVEDFSDRSSIHQRISELETFLANTLDIDLSKVRQGFESLDLKTHEQRRNNAWELDNLKNRIPFFEKRESPPRCLMCASIYIVHLRFDPPTEGQGSVRLGFVNPTCGGSLFIETTSRRINMSLDNIFYDREGRRMK